MAAESVTPADRFLRSLVRSGLLNRAQIAEVVTPLGEEVRRDVARLADQFVQSQALTPYQVSKLLQGTWQGLVLGPYHILAPLGKGGMGTVYLARDTRDVRLTALKILSPKRAREEERTLARFLREMELCQRVSHPHLTKTYEAGILQGVYFIAMEYIPGMPLSRYVTQNGSLQVAHAARVFAEVAAALQHAHDLGLIHRDLKPSNLMITPKGHAKVLDLGLAITLGEEATDDKTIIGGLGYILGTMDYIAPEQAEDSTNVDARSDLYALGCTMYFALTGRPPFPGGTSLQKLMAHRDRYPDPISELNPTVPSEFAQIVERLMAKRPERRYASANAVREMLLLWAKNDIDRPLDVSPDQSESEALQEIEAEHAPEATVWESIPVIAYGDTAKRTDPVLLLPTIEAQSPQPVPSKPRPIGVSTLGLIVGVLGLYGLMLLLEMLRRI